MRILADATLPGLDAAFPKPFIITLYSNTDELTNLLDQQPDILLCRSTLKVNADLLKNHQLKCVATASSGTDHLDHLFLNSQGISIIDAKGSNAVAVADYIVACLAHLDQHHLSQGKQAGIIGMGKVGVKVYERLKAAGFQIAPYDPLKAQREEFQSCTLDQLLQADVLCIHAELHNHPPFPSLNLINDTFLARLKPGCVIINAARGGIVNEEALLNKHQHLIYCTDVYLNEPSINQQIVEMAELCTPHIAGHSLEAKWAAITMVSEKIHSLLGLPIPEYDLSSKIQQVDLQKPKSWQEKVLSIYNPVEETLVLKQAQDKETAFFNLRKKHQNRHDFSVYSNLISDQKTRLLFGITWP